MFIGNIQRIRMKHLELHLSFGSLLYTVKIIQKISSTNLNSKDVGLR